MNTEFFLYLCVYFGLLLLVGFFFSKKLKSLEDFFLASRDLPAFLILLTLAGSWLGATSTLVSVDEAVDKGISSFWVIGIPSIVTVVVFALFLVRPIRRLPFVSLPDLMEKRYSRAVRHLAAVMIVWYMVLLAASQMVAMGSFLRSFLGTSYFIALCLGTGVVLLYSVFGGLFSVVITDGFQFFLLVAGIIGLLFSLMGMSSWDNISISARALGKSDFFNFFLDFDRSIWIAFSFTLAWIISPIVWQRIQAARTERDARVGLLGSGGIFFVFFGCIVCIGILALPLSISADRTDTILSVLIHSHLGKFLGGILFLAIIAAIMSTMDTAINTGALSLTRDVYQQFIPLSHQKNAVIVSRVSTIILGVFAFFIATRFQDILKTLGLASEVMAEGMFVPGIAMVFLRKKYPFAGMLSLLLGSGFAVVGFLNGLDLIRFDWPQWPFSVPFGLGLSFGGFVFGFLIDRYASKIPRSKT
ncbi:MAG: sodium:solute symporter family protein [Candidatus Aminicenantes bacterium]